MNTESELHLKLERCMVVLQIIISANGYEKA